MKQMNQRAFRRGRRAAAALLCALALALSGCGGSAGGQTGGQAAEAAGRTAPAENEAAALPVLSDFAAGPAWDGSSAPDRSNGPWAQSCAVFDALAKAAADYASVTPQRSFSLAVHDPAESGPGQLAGGWANAVTVATRGAVRINVGYSATLSGATTSMDDMKQGLIDFVWTLPCYFKGYMPLTNVIQNPSLALPSGSAASRVMWELFQSQSALRKEYADDGVPLFVCANCTSPLSYKGSGELGSVSEIHGNIRANNGPAQLFVDAAGATVFSCPIGEVYNNVQHGIIDFLVTDWNGVDSFKLSDPGVLNYYLDTNIGCSAFALVANTDIWDSIDPALREQIRSASGDYMLNLAGIWDYWEALGRYHAVENGGTVYAPSEALAAELDALYTEVAQRWIEAQSDPQAARALYEAAQSLAQAAGGAA